MTYVKRQFSARRLESMSRDKAYLEDIGGAATKIAEFISGMSLEAFRKDEKTQLAILYLLTTIGEAARRLSDEVRAMDVENSLRKAIATRNVIVHQYDAVDVDIVWQTALDDVPQVRAMVENIVRELRQKDPNE